MSLDGSIRVFEKTTNGVDLKNNLVSLLLALVDDSSFIANDMFGYTAGSFVEKETLRADAASINGSLEYILSESVEAASIYDSLTKISGIKDGIRNAINDLYGSTAIPSTGEASYFENYVDALHYMPDLLNVKTLEDIEITENGEYEADSGQAYGNVLVNIPEKTLTTRVITRNGTYYAQQDGADGYEYVQVSVTGSVPSYTVRFWSEDHSNILYTALNVPHGGYAQFDGTYPEHEGLYFSKWNPVPTNVTSDMDCYPVFSNIPSSEIEITDSWETIVANKGANYPIGSYKNIEFDAFAKMIIERRNASTGKDYNGMIIIDKPPLKAIKAFAGEGGSTSTWLAVGRNVNISTVTYYDEIGGSALQSVNLNWPVIQMSVNAYNYDGNVLNDDVEICWKNSSIRRMLNEDLLSAFPDVLKNNIVAVPKNSAGLNTSTNEIFNSQTRDKLWLPSSSEILGSVSRPLYNDIAQSIEIRKCIDNSIFNGVEYSKIFFEDSSITYGGQTLYPINASRLELKTASTSVGPIYARDKFGNKSSAELYGYPKTMVGDTYYWIPQFIADTGAQKAIVNSLQSQLVIGFCL